MRKHSRELQRRFQAQQGVVSRADVLSAGLTDREISVRLHRGEWVRVHAGVYRLGGAPETPEQRILGAVLACGPAAVASHQAAAWLWDLLERPPERPVVTVPRRSNPRRVGLEVHRMGPVAPDRCHQRRGVWCTDPLRTLADLGAVVPERALDAAVDRALATRLVTVRGLEAEAGRRSERGRRGSAVLRERLRRRGFVAAPHPSVLESRTLRLLAGAGIVARGVEVPAGEGWYRVDVLVADGLAVEVNGYAYHWSPEFVAADEARRNRIELSGTVVLTYTWWDVTHDQARVIRQIREGITMVRGGTPRRAGTAG